METGKRKKKRSNTTNKKPKNLKEYLYFLYSNPLTTANSIEGLYNQAIKNNRFNFSISKENVRLFLMQQKTYQQAQPIKREFKQQKCTVIKDRNLKWQMDLIDLRNYKDDNNGIQYALTIIDVFSKYTMVFPLRDKREKHVAKILHAIFDQIKPLSGWETCTRGVGLWEYTGKVLGQRGAQ